MTESKAEPEPWDDIDEEQYQMSLLLEKELEDGWERYQYKMELKKLLQQRKLA